jgi:16S rRNA (cytosine967-C5)-methyltransferase
MNVPDHAVVNTMVDLCAVMNLGRAKGLVNAVLRRVLSEGKDWIANQDAARINLPDWLIRDWATDYDLRTAADMALAAQSAAMLDITLKDPSQTAYWAQQLEAELLPTGSLRRAAGGHISDLPGFAEGAWWVQDAAAAIPVLLMGDIADKNVADLCAAPGGKTAQLAARGARVHALDRAATRLKRLQENMDRLTLADRVTVEAGDAVQWQPQKKFDAVLIDAPCSATGTLRRHPDVAHLKTPEDIDRLCTMQAAILDNAATLLVPGGVMVYCTCSLQKAEGERQIDAFLARHPDFSRQPITADALGGLGQAITKDGDVRILPQFWSERGGMDGFYIARLTRQE